MSIAEAFCPFTAPVPVLSAEQTAALIAASEVGFAMNPVPNPEEVFWLDTPCDLRDAAAKKLGLDWRVINQRHSYMSYRVSLAKLPEVRDAIQARVVKDLTPKNIYLQVLVTQQKTYRLFARYQTIIGSKLLHELTQAQWDALVDVGARGIQAMLDSGQILPEVKAAAPVAVAPAKPLDAKGELALLIPDGQRLMLPKTQLKHYADIKVKLQKAGGEYNSKGWFEFAQGIDPAQVLASLLGGNTVNGKKDSQSFFTPAEVAQQVCAQVAPKPGMRVLEPSGGGGALADPVRAAGAEIVVIENYPVNVHLLKEKGYDVIEQDFLTVSPADIGQFDAIVANPPFSRNQDIDHVLHMVKFLKPGGTLSVIMSQSWMAGSQKKQVAFRDFLAANQAHIEPIDAGAFKESGTSVATAHVTFKKAA